MIEPLLFLWWITVVFSSQIAATITTKISWHWIQHPMYLFFFTHFQMPDISRIWYRMLRNHQWKSCPWFCDLIILEIIKSFIFIIVSHKICRQLIIVWMINRSEWTMQFFISQLNHLFSPNLVFGKRNIFIRILFKYVSSYTRIIIRKEWQ